MAILAGLKGWVGEVVFILAKKIMLDGHVYRDLNNVTIMTSNGTTQIDHVIVSRYGIFVIETKNMEGWIFGSENQPRWTQSFHRARFQFQNPLHQNFRHIKALQQLLGLDAEDFHSVVCFLGTSCKFKTAMPPNVINGGPFRYIKSKVSIVFSDERVDEIVSVIRSAMRPKGFLGLSTTETRDEHLSSLKSRHGSTTACPKCGSALVPRVVKKGPREGARILACSAFPGCRFVRPVADL